MDTLFDWEICMDQLMDAAFLEEHAERFGSSTLLVCVFVCRECGWLHS